ncbi:hypothetical protein [Aquibacillus sediminis]|nr:hypothetical protein [Aquibacillus sediminis]
MTENNKDQFKRSYESDGVMGVDKKTKSKKQENKNKKDAMFFNTTESSE